MSQSWAEKKKIIVNTIMVLSIIMCMYLNMYACIIPHIVHSTVYEIYCSEVYYSNDVEVGEI